MVDPAPPDPVGQLRPPQIVGRCTIEFVDQIGRSGTIESLRPFAHGEKVFLIFFIFFFRSPKFDFVRSAATPKLALSSKLSEIDLFEVADHLSCLRCNWFLSIESFHSFRGRMEQVPPGDFVYLNLIWLRTGESGESDTGDPPAARTGASLGDSTGGQSERSHADQRPIAAIIPPSAAHWRPVATLSARWLCRWTAFARYEKEPHFFFLHTRVLSTIFFRPGKKKEKKNFILKRLLIFSFSSSSSSLGCDDVQFMLERTPAARVSVESSPRSNSKWKLPTASRPRELFFFNFWGRGDLKETKWRLLKVLSVCT